MAISFPELWLDEFQVPVAELVPDEVVDSLRGFVELEFPERVVELPADPGQAASDPAVGQTERLRVGLKPSSSRFIRTKREAFQILLAKAR